jgi:hypothetical protein
MCGRCDLHGKLLKKGQIKSEMLFKLITFFKLQTVDFKVVLKASMSALSRFHKIYSTRISSIKIPLFLVDEDEKRRKHLSLLFINRKERV